MRIYHIAINAPPNAKTNPTNPMPATLVEPADFPLVEPVVLAVAVVDAVVPVAPPVVAAVAAPPVAAGAPVGAEIPVTVMPL